MHHYDLFGSKVDSLCEHLPHSLIVQHVRVYLQNDDVDHYVIDKDQSSFERLRLGSKKSKDAVRQYEGHVSIVP